jgi:hypothetical protein
MRYRGTGEINLKFGAGLVLGHFERLTLNTKYYNSVCVCIKLEFMVQHKLSCELVVTYQLGNTELTYDIL